MVEPSLKPTYDTSEIADQLFQSAPDAIVLVDGGGAIVRVNAMVEEMFGFSAGELIGQPLEVLMPERFRRGHVAHRDHYIESPSSRPMGAGLELYGCRKDGTEFPVDIMLAPLNTENGRAVMAVVRDITERPSSWGVRRMAS